jgi:hypothetical protein
VSIDVYLQSDVPTFRTRLSRTVAWCSAQPLESSLWKPPKSRSDGRWGTRGQVVAARPRIPSAKFLEVASEAINNPPPDTWICFLEQ